MVKYLIDDEEVDEFEFYDRLEEGINAECENTYDDMLDDCSGTFEIGYLTFTASQVLYNCDRIAYDCGLSDYQSDKLEEAKSELDYGSVDVDGYTYEIVEEDDEEEEEE